MIWGTILSLLVASAWYLPMYQANGWKFVDEFFIQHHFQRYTSNKYQHPQPFYFFFWVLPLMTIPWLPFFFAALWKIIKNLISKFKVQESKPSILLLSSSPLLLVLADRAARFLFGFRLETARLYSARSAGGFDFDGAICLRIRAEIADEKNPCATNRVFNFS